MAAAVWHGSLLPLDERALGWVAAWRDCDSMRAAAALSVIGAGEVSLLLTALAAGWCLWRRQPQTAAALFLLYLSIPVEFALKHWLAQPLPGSLFPVPDACEWYRPALSVRTPHSFPSGYAIRVTYFGALLLIWLATPAGHLRGHWRAAGLVALASLLVGLLGSRLVLSWHWPSDLLAGALLGFALAAATRAASLTTLPGWVPGVWGKASPSGSAPASRGTR